MNKKSVSRRTFIKSLSAAAASLPFLSVQNPANAYAAGEKMLILYFSHSGNTENIARFIGQNTQSTVYRILPQVPYPQNYNETLNLTEQEYRQNRRPQFAGTLPNFDDYQTVFVGYPCWWGTMPMIFFTLFEQHNMTGKRIIPFTTHEGSRFGRSLQDLQKLCPQAIIAEGLEVRGSRSKNALPLVTEWLASLGI